VVIAAYNVADIIGEALESLRRQTRSPLEVIVCDDGSIDDLDGALEPYRDRIALVRKKNGGEASAKNAAAQSARGDFVAILDADDVYLPSRLEALSELAQARPDLDILTTDGFLLAGGNVVRNVYDGSYRFEVNDQRRAILEHNFVFGLAAVRRELLLRSGGFDESIFWTTDWDLWLRLILAGARAGCVDEPLAYYRLRESSLTARRRELLLGKLATLRKARLNPDLRRSERAILERSLERYERQLALFELHRAVAADEKDARTRAIKLARRRGYPFRVRLGVVATAAAPAISRRFLQRRESKTWVGAGGIRVPRSAPGADG
jgi:glycosyltransferase involved in cell wall biosynthesis